MTEVAILGESEGPEVPDETLDEVQMLGRVYVLLQPFGYQQRMRMLRYLIARSWSDEQKRLRKEDDWSEAEHAGDEATWD